MSTTFYVFTFQVRGATPFPTDMLAREKCFPVSTGDASALAIVMVGRAGAKPTRASFFLRTYSPYRTWMPSYEEWRARGWNVVGAVKGHPA